MIGPLSAVLPLASLRTSENALWLQRMLTRHCSELQEQAKNSSYASMDKSTQRLRVPAAGYYSTVPRSPSLFRMTSKNLHFVSRIKNKHMWLGQSLKRIKRSCPDSNRGHGKVQSIGNPLRIPC